MAESGGWSTIESDAGVFTSLIEQLGVKDVQFEELISLDAETICALSPVYGVIFLFKWIGAASQNRDVPADGSYDDVAVDQNGLFFAAQTIQNACGTQAILSVILNNDKRAIMAGQGGGPAPTGVDLGSSLQEFKDFTMGFDAGLIGESLSNQEMIREVHNSFAKSSPFVDETARDPSAGTEDVFHFIGYTSQHGKLYELDGLQPFPISHGDCTPEEFPEKIIPILQRRIARYPGDEIRFNLMAVCQDQRIKAREFQDMDMLAREEQKRKQWDFENALRRHNFVPFTMELLKGIMKVKLKDGTCDAWIDEAKQATVKRLKDRQKYGGGGD